MFKTTSCRFDNLILSNVLYAQIILLPRDAMRKRGLCCRPVSVHLSLYVCHVGGLYPDS